jgi:hypothetical protein
MTMWMIKRRFYKLGLTLLLAGLLAGCGGGSHSSSNRSNGSLVTVSPSDAALLTLTPNSAVDVAALNGTSMYVLITAEPGDKPESNNYDNELLLKTYSFALGSKTGAGTKQAVLRPGISSKVAAGAANTMYSAAQIASDKRLRAQENELLASKAKQLSNDTSPLLKAIAPTGNIAKNDSWKGVWVNDVQIDTTCCCVSDYAYIFVDNRDVGKLSSHIEEYGEAFDRIYQNNHQHFGKENDVDRNGKVIIVFSEELCDGYMGYFDTFDKYKWDAIKNPHSNQGDIIYITADTDYLDYVKETMAHEFQHMIYFDQHYNKGVSTTYVWLNEALSQAAQYYNYRDGVYLPYLHEYNINSFLNNSPYYAYSGLSLTYWTEYNYGFGAIFIRYLIDQYGPDVTKNMCSTQYVGIKAVEQATGVDFNTLFTNFVRALVLSDRSTASTDSVYKFNSLKLSNYGGLAALTPTLTAGSGLGNGSIYPYSINFYPCSGTFGTMTLSGNGVTGTVFGL